MFCREGRKRAWRGFSIARGKDKRSISENPNNFYRMKQQSLASHARAPRTKNNSVTTIMRGFPMISSRIENDPLFCLFRSEIPWS